MTLGMGILSWKGGDTLKQSLNSYANANLFSLFDETVIFLPEQGDYETQIAKDFNLKIFGSDKNLGILGGFKALAQSMTADYILLLENDCPLIEDFTEAQKQIIRYKPSPYCTPASQRICRSRLERCPKIP